MSAASRIRAWLGKRRWRRHASSCQRCMVCNLLSLPPDVFMCREGFGRWFVVHKILSPACDCKLGDHVSAKAVARVAAN